MLSIDSITSSESGSVTYSSMTSTSLTRTSSSSSFCNDNELLELFGRSNSSDSQLLDHHISNGEKTSGKFIKKIFIIARIFLKKFPIREFKFSINGYVPPRWVSYIELLLTDNTRTSHFPYVTCFLLWKIIPPKCWIRVHFHVAET